jgi:HD-like signal output (HDOD) protein
VQTPTDECDYVAGLVHDVGKIVMAWSFPDHFSEIHNEAKQGERDLIEIENEVLGIDHAELGALYLERHRLPELMVKAARFHHQPEKADSHAQIIGAVQIADLLLRREQIGCSGNYVEITNEHVMEVSRRSVLFPNAEEAQQAIERAAFHRSLEQLPGVLEGLV